jgi:hypothetical protein
MKKNSRQTLAVLIALSAFAAVITLASGCELVVKLDVESLENDSGGAPPCTLCLDGTVEPDGYIEFGPRDAATEADVLSVDAGLADTGADGDP